MRKWASLIVLLAIIFAVAYFFLIRSNIETHVTYTMKAGNAAIARLLLQNDQWQKWWPGTADKANITDSSFMLNDYTYTVTGRQFNSISVKVSKEDKTITNTTLLFVDSTVNFVKANWFGSIPSTTNPIAQWQHHKDAVAIEKGMQLLLDKMNNFFSNNKNVYGIDIKIERVKDSTLVSTYDSVKGYPTIEKIYGLADELKQYIDQQHASVTGYPMLNIYTTDSSVYQVKVAFPVDKKLPPKGRIAYKWMLAGGYILVADVKGGNNTVEAAFKQVEYFAKDFHHLPPAISFYSLMTDRRQQKDSTQWMTRIYYPIME